MREVSKRMIYGVGRARYTPAMKPLLALLALAAPVLAADPAAMTNSIGMKLVPIPAGEFIMGHAAERPKTADEWAKRDYDESPAHKVKITRDFYLGATEVTNAQYEQFDPAHKKFRGRGDVSK